MNKQFVKNELSKKMGYDSWDELNGKTVGYIQFTENEIDKTLESIKKGNKFVYNKSVIIPTNLNNSSKIYFTHNLSKKFSVYYDSCEVFYYEFITNDPSYFLTGNINGNWKFYKCEMK